MSHRTALYTTRILLPVFVLLLSTTAVAGEKISKPLKKAHDATCSVMTYDKEGKLVATGQGFFVGDKGELLTGYELFRGAVSAVCTDAAGITRPVQKVNGADELYNIVRVTTEPDKKQHALATDSLVAAEGERLYLPPVAAAKKEAGSWLTVSKVEQVGGTYSYYTLAGPAATADISGRPLLTEDGRLAAITQPSAVGDSIFYALDARFGTAFEIKALTLNESSYRNLIFPKQLPLDIEQAQVYLFMAGNQSDSEFYAQVIEDFIGQFPESSDGYIRRAALQINKGDNEHYALAEADQAKALELAENKDDIHFQIARQIVSAVQADSTLSYNDWSLSRAIEETEKAIAINPLTAYYQQIGDIRYAMGDLEGTLEAYKNICAANDATADHFFNASLVCEQLPDHADEAIALMDSAVVKASPAGATPDANLAYQSAPYVLERALMKARQEKYRASVADFNLYEQLAGTSANDRFYYLREQTEANARMYQQALDDIDMALSINPLAVYLLEKASLNVRVGRYDVAIPLFENLLLSYPDDMDCARMLGFCHAMKGDKAKAKPLFERAAALGDPNAAGLIEKYCK